MAAKTSKLTELTDIPLSLEQGDGLEMTATDKNAKSKSNSLKRFFRTAKASMTTSRSQDSSDPVCDSELSNVRSLQLRFGSFHKNDEPEEPPQDIEAGSSGESLKPKSSFTESRLKLQGRISNYFSTTFKKSSKKPQTNNDFQLKDIQTSPPPPSDINKIDQNQPDNL